MEISRVVCLGILLVFSAADIRFRGLPTAALAAANIAAVIFQLFSRKEDILILLGGAAAGALFFLVSKATEEAVGYGDSWGILSLGIYLGLWNLMEVLAGAFCLLAAAGVLVLLIGKMKRKTALPFYPFLAAGYALWLASGPKP